MLLTSVVASFAAFLTNIDSIREYLFEPYVPAVLTIRDISPGRIKADDLPGGDNMLWAPFTIVVEKQTEGTAKNCSVVLFEDNLSSPFLPEYGKSRWGDEEEGAYIFSLEENVRSIEVEIQFNLLVSKAPDNYNIEISVACDGIVSNKVMIPSAWQPGWDAAG
ncbi:hypothetical protein [Rhizobium laguerreae]|uniref:hypothetical protein n=1 Tax=Rhizobium laguerreae TaxID=1076926 RepID=UPI001C90ADD6|nr:hypothetical protein [Rhizobium laguerreae]MBY3314728.1 hypothetical protein [Rhizobium laguerreae]